MQGRYAWFETVKGQTMNQTHRPPIYTSGKLAPTGTAAFSGIRADILLGGKQAPMTVMAMTIAPGMGAPVHISHGEDKVFLIGEGRLVFLVDTRKIVAKAGEYVFIPKGVPHGFTAVGRAATRMTLVSTPGRHDRFFQAMAALSLPHRMAEVQSVCARFDQAIVGPIVQP